MDNLTEKDVEINDDSDFINLHIKDGEQVKHYHLSVTTLLKILSMNAIDYEYLPK